ncbi:MAG: hypothetical protein SNJ52_00705 [Verrucomicrobiia bacterium]
MALIELKEVCKYYPMGEEVVKALDDATFDIHEGEYLAILGPSGSGRLVGNIL